MSPATPEPPIPHTTTWRSPRPSGRSFAASAARYPSLSCEPMAATSPSMPPGSAAASEDGSSNVGVAVLMRPPPLGEVAGRASGARWLLGFLDQHDRDVVPDGVPVPALQAHDDLLRLPVLDLAPAVGADQDVQ